MKYTSCKLSFMIVHGHQYDRTPNKELSLEVQLSIHADTLAIKITTFLILGNYYLSLSIYINNKYISYNIVKYLISVLHIEESTKFIKQKYSWSNTKFPGIIWKHHTSFMKLYHITSKSNINNHT